MFSLSSNNGTVQHGVGNNELARQIAKLEEPRAMNNTGTCEVRGT